MGNTLKFSESGVRGIVGEGLTPRLVVELGAAFGSYLGGGRIVIGRDTRETGLMFEDALTAGLLSAGCEVVKLGVTPTPTIQFTVISERASGGVAITASHNPPQWNALKFIGPRGTFLAPGEASELFELYSSGHHSGVAEHDLRRVRIFADPFASHMAKILESVDAEAIRSRHFPVAVDCCNGTGALVSVRFLEELGCCVTAVNGEPRGDFARPAEPLPENLAELCRVVRESRSAVGFAQDPDGDRLTVVTDRGEAMTPHYTLALAVDEMLDNGDPGPVVVNTQTSQLVERITDGYGCELLTAKVGEINVVNKMLESGSMIGGEGNCGGVILSRVHPGRDSFTAMALVLERLARSRETLSQIVAAYPTFTNLNARFPVPPRVAAEAVETFAARYRQYEPLTFDGLRFDLPGEGRVLMRSSNTEPILRLNVESQEPDKAAALLNRFTAEIRTLLNLQEPGV